MDVSEIIAELDAHGFTDTPVSQKMAAINETYWDACGMEPWPFLEKFYRLNFNGLDAFPTDLPADFHAATSMKTEGGIAIDFMRHDRFEELYGSNTVVQGTPRLFYFIGNQLNFYPVPPSGMRVRMGYIMSPTKLASTDLEAVIILPLQYHRAILVNGALYKLYAEEDDMELSGGFQSFYDRAMARMREFVWKKHYTAPDIIHPIDPDDLGWEGSYGGW